MTANITNRTFRALVGQRAFDFAFENGQLLLDGEAVTYTFEPVSDRYYSLLIDGQSLPVFVEEEATGRLRITVDGKPIDVHVKDEKALLLERFGLNEASDAAKSTVHAPMPGLVLNIMVKPGQHVQAGDGLLVLEAMKMENELRAHADGVVKTLHVIPGDAVVKNALLLEFEA